MSDEVLLVAKNIGRRLGARWLWRGLELEVRAGERLAVVGPTGSGKTLLLRSLAGLDKLDEGEVELLGTPSREWEPPRYRSLITYLPQRVAVAEGTVADNLRLVLGLKQHRGRVWDRGRVVALLESLGRTAAFLEKAATELSGGEGQILALLRALQLDPRILLLDEATASLDPDTTAQVEALLIRWLKEGPGRACLWTSHDPRQLERLATRRVEVARG